MITADVDSPKTKTFGPKSRSNFVRKSNKYLVRPASDNIPDIFSGVAEFTACNTGAQAVIANTDRFIFEGIGKIIFSFSHSSDENANAFFRCKALDVVSNSDHFGIKTECDFAAVRWQMICYWVFYDFEQFFLRVG